MKKYSFLAISDVHLGWKLFNIPELAEDLKEMFVKVVDKAIELDVTYLIVVGDLYDINRPPPDLVSFVQEQVNRLKRNHITPIGIAGDHDKPINDAAWVHLSGFQSLEDNTNSGRFLAYDYNDNSPALVERLKTFEGAAKVEWIFLHGQVPELFPWVEEKKLLNLKDVDLVGMYPKLKGVILGDIHNPYEGTIPDPSGKRDEIYIGYCGSLGVVKSDEANYPRPGVLYFDGKELTRVPVPLDRLYVRLRVETLVDPQQGYLEKYRVRFKEEKKKPVLMVEFDKTCSSLLPQAHALDDLAFVKDIRKAHTDSDKPQETINLRSELKTQDRIAQVLKRMAPDEETFELVHNIVTSDDAKRVLDELKASIFNE